MSKSRSKSRSQSKKKRTSSPTPGGRSVVRAQPSVAAKVAAVSSPPGGATSRVADTRKLPSYAHVFKDLRRIGVLAGTVLVIIIVLAIVLR